MKGVAFLLVFAASCAFAGGDASRQVIVRSEFIAEESPTAQCHASTIVEVEGRLMAAWFGGTRRGTGRGHLAFLQGHIHLESSRSSCGWRSSSSSSTHAGILFCTNFRQGPLMLFTKWGRIPGSGGEC